MPLNLLIPLEEIIHSSFQINQENGVYKLMEKAEVDYPITEVSTKGQVKIYSFDENNLELLPFFSNITYVNKCVDYLLLSQKGNTVYAFLVELKSNNYKAAYKQFCASIIFVNYIIEMAKSYSNVVTKQNADSLLLEIRCILVTTAKISFKSPTNPRKGVVYKTHEQYGYKSIPLKAGKTINIDLFFD